MLLNYSSASGSVFSVYFTRFSLQHINTPTTAAQYFCFGVLGFLVVGFGEKISPMDRKHASVHCVSRIVYQLARMWQTH